MERIELISLLQKPPKGDLSKEKRNVNTVKNKVFLKDLTKTIHAL
jgi:hypothetical protein